MPRHEKVNYSLAYRIVRDELFEKTLYEKLAAGRQTPEASEMLKELVSIETGHVKFWQDFFGLKAALGLWDRALIRLVGFVCALLGSGAVLRLAEWQETRSVREYMEIWDVYRGSPLGAAVRRVLADEFVREKTLVARLTRRTIDADKVRASLAADLRDIVPPTWNC